jgi:hypothetical protein
MKLRGAAFEHHRTPCTPSAPSPRSYTVRGEKCLDSYCSANINRTEKPSPRLRGEGDTERQRSAGEGPFIRSSLLSRHPLGTAPYGTLAAVDFPSFLEKWKDSSGNERANKDQFLTDLCRVLGVDPPQPTTGDPERDRFVFERDAVFAHEGGRSTIGKIDLYKEGCFLLEAKQGSDEKSRKLGTARRNTASWNIAMHDAFGQALGYAKTLDQPPPFLIVCDIGFCFDLYATFDGSWNHRPFPHAQQSRIFLADIEKHADLLRTIFTDARSLDPSRNAAKVTREIAGHLADLARSLEEAKHDPERVAKFLMRCVFTMFAEDVQLLARETFVKMLDGWWENPEQFVPEVEAFWRTMNEGGSLPHIGRILRFNGGLFADPTALPLDKRQLWILRLAAKQDWADVEPAIFGTLLERALNAKERHRLGAHYTPRAYVERLVKPTIEEPLREEWELVRAEVRTIIAEGKDDDDRKAAVAARKPVHAFYDRLRKLRILDPACGSGNFLFVALDVLKRLENEVLDLLHDLGDTAMFVTHGNPISPEQFLGIEIKPWAKEIAELVLWIGYLQWQIRTRGWRTNVPEPVLRDYHNIECRDAVLAYDSVEPLLDDEGKPVTRWDGETMKVHPVTGKEVPDESARVAVMTYVNPTKAVWPPANFIVGNPPFVGNKKMRTAFGDGYVEALREAHRDVADTADFVMYWWDHAAELLRRGEVTRFGLITTNSITQVFNRKVLQRHLNAPDGLSIVFAIADHPWVDSVDGAAVRVAMTTASRGDTMGTLLEVIEERPGDVDAVSLAFVKRHGRIHENLRVGADSAGAGRLRSNAGISFMGVTLVGKGFRLSAEDAASYGSEHVRPYLTGRELTQQSESRFVVDLFGLLESEAALTEPRAYQHLLDHVRAERQTNQRMSYREKWWIFGEPRANMRAALKGTERYIATPETSKFRFFVFLSTQVLPDHTLFAIALADGFHLGVLSSRLQVVWSFAAGSKMGVGNDLRWRNNTCFDPFPFPAANEDQKQHIRDLGEQLDAHRKRQQALHPELTITGMYNVLEKLRSGEALSAKEKVIHEQGLVSILKQIHEDLDAAVFDAYGWPATLTDEEILERLVALNHERAEEEKRGLVCWLRPEYQNPSGAQEATQKTMAGLVPAEDYESAAAAEVPIIWPAALPQQLSAVRQVLMASSQQWSMRALTKRFSGAKKKELERALESLQALGIVVSEGAGDATLWTALRPLGTRATPAAT